LLQPPELVSDVEMPIASVSSDDEEPTQLPVAGEATSSAELANRLTTVIDVLKELLQDLEPLVQAAALYALAQLDSQQGREQARQLLTLEKPGDKLLLLFETNLLKSVKPDALIELACQAKLRVYPQGAIVCKAGEPSDELLLLVDGEADVSVEQGETEVVINTVQGGQTIGEMGVLTRKPRSANVITKAARNRALVIAAKDFETVLRNDSEVSRSLLLDVIARLQRLTARVQAQR
jgi:hypothetical protein